MSIHIVRLISQLSYGINAVLVDGVQHVIRSRIAVKDKKGTSLEHDARTVRCATATRYVDRVLWLRVC